MLPCVFITTTSPSRATVRALCSIRLSPEWHHTVSAEPMTRGDAHTGRMPESMAPSRDMQSATCALDASPKAWSNAPSGRAHASRTRKPGLPFEIAMLFEVRDQPAGIQNLRHDLRKLPRLHRRAGGYIMNHHGVPGLDTQLIPFANRAGVADHRKQPVVHCVAIIRSRKTGRDHRSNPRAHHRRDCDLHGRSASKVFPSHNHIAGLNGRRKFGSISSNRYRRSTPGSRLSRLRREVMM